MISRRHFLRLLAGLGAASASTVAYGFGEPALRLRVTRYDLRPPQWPADLKLKIAAIADLHACDPWMELDRIAGDRRAHQCAAAGYHRAARRLCRRACAQVTRYIPASEWAPVLGGLRAPLGVHAVLGNHDWWEDKTVQREGQGPTDRPARARSRRHSGLRKRCGAADQGRPAVLAGRARRSTGLSAGAALSSGPPHRRRRSRRDAWRR